MTTYPKNNKLRIKGGSNITNTQNKTKMYTANKPVLLWTSWGSADKSSCNHRECCKNSTKNEERTNEKI